ncbi:acyl-CoA thioesterase [Mycobacterium tuberculosis]|nr:acyl-CoA thioesterase [Mycobacterium tuberculosis]
MIRAVWNGTVLAEAPRTVRVEGNHYFPPESLHREHLIESPTTSICPWKGLAHYYNVVVDGPYGPVNPDAAWYTAGPVHWLAGSKTMLRSGTV